MLVISDSGPISYLILLGHDGLLPRLFDGVVIPRAVAIELSHPHTPEAIRLWQAAAPSWLTVDDAAVVAQDMKSLGAGETAAIVLCQRLDADALLCDDAAARMAARGRGLRVIGTLGILRDAAIAGMIDGPAALERLRKETNFRVSQALFNRILMGMGYSPDDPSDAAPS